MEETKKATMNVCSLILIQAILLSGRVSAQIEISRIGGQRWAVLVGIDDYEHLPQLNFAVNDTVWLCSALAEACQFPTENIFPLVTDWKRIKSVESSEGPPLTEDFWQWFERHAEKPTKDGLVSRLQWLKSKVRPGDLVLFHFSGHGILLESEAHIAMVEADTADLRVRGRGCVRMDDLSAILRSLPAQAVLVVFDACRQNLARGIEAGAADTPSNTLHDAFSRNIVIRPSAQGQLDIAATLFSCKVGQASHEWTEKKHGFFSYFLTRALLGAAADESGKVTLNSLEAYLSREVAAAVKRQLSREQVPWLAREGTDPGSLILAWSGLLPPGFRVPSGSKGSVSEIKTICVHNFSSITEESDSQHLGIGLSEGICSRLANAPKIRVVERSQLRQVTDELKLQRPDLANQKTIANLGNLLGADYSLVGSFESGNILKINTRVVDNLTGEVVYGVSETGSDRNYLEVAIAKKVAQSLGSSFPELAITTQIRDEPVQPEHRDEALAFFDAKEYAKAFHLYGRISDQDINDIQIHRRIETCARLGNLERQFLERYLALVERYPKNAAVHNYLGNAYLMVDFKDENGKAREQYAKALRLHPEFAAPHNNLGIVTIRQGDIAKAESEFKHYVDACPDDAVGWVNLGLLHLRKVKEDPNRADAVRSAEEAFHKGLQINPTLASGYKGLGQLYVAIGRKKEALAFYQRSFALNHDQPEVRQQIELLAWEQGEARAVGVLVDDFETRSALRRGSIMELSSRTIQSLAQRDFRKAEALATELCRHLPGNRLTYLLLARAYEGQGQNIRASRALEEAERLSK